MGKELLIIGKVPPPIGGVTIHVERLLTQLKLANVPHAFVSLTKQSIFFLVFKIASFKVVHIHSSNPLIRLYLLLLTRLWGVKSVVTIHGNIGRFGSAYKNIADKWAIKLASKPIVLNEGSLRQAIVWNSNTELISAFIPPVLVKEYLSEDDTRKIQNLVVEYERTFCTNAYNKSYDKNGVEIYGIYELIESFRSFPKFALVISDPSGAYTEEIKVKDLPIPNNVILITGLHSFYKVMTLVDSSIRNTTTDGDSLSVKESLHLKKRTFTSDVVQRPQGCILYTRGCFSTVLADLDKQKEVKYESENLNGYPKLKEIYALYFTT